MVRPTIGPEHALGDGWRFASGGLEIARRTKHEFGEKTKVGSCRGPTIPVAGATGAGSIAADDDLAFDGDVALEDGIATDDQGLRMRRNIGVDVAPGEGRIENTPPKTTQTQI